MTVDAATLARGLPARRASSVRTRAFEFLAVGGATFLLFPLAWLLRRAFGSDASLLAVGFLTFHGAYLVNDPHFSVTYLLFYEDVRERMLGRTFSVTQRIRYAVAGFVVPAVLCGWAGYALLVRSAGALGFMVQLMYLLVGWHYVKQGFGVFAVLSARRGSPVSARERRIILFHCFAGWAYAWASPSVPAGDYEEKGVVFRALAHPRWLELLTGGALAISIVLLAWLLATKWLRERRTLPFAPFVSLLVTVWAWSIYSSIDPLVQYVIPALHSVQYLYFVGLMKRNEHRASAGPFAGSSTPRLVVLALSALGLGFVLFHGAPGLLDAAFAPRHRGVPRGDLGPTPYAAAFFVAVNIHHYFMDNVIWRRENPNMRHLFQP